MSNLQLTAKFKIQDGKLDAFKELEAACIDAVKTKDQGTLQYDWFYSADGSECVVRERYVDSDALLQHMQHVGPYLGQMMEIGSFSVELCGTPSEALLKATEGLDVKIYAYAGGI